MSHHLRGHAEFIGGEIMVWAPDLALLTTDLAPWCERGHSVGHINQGTHFWFVILRPLR